MINREYTKWSDLTKYILDNLGLKYSHDNVDLYHNGLSTNGKITIFNKRKRV